MRRPSRPWTRQNLANRLLIYFVVVWMAVFYPAVCQYHGLLLFGMPPGQRQHDMQIPTGATPAVHEHAVTHHAGGTEKLSTPATPQNVANHASNAAVPGLRHKTFPLETTPLSLLALALPQAVPFTTPQSHTDQHITVLLLAHQHQISPPEQPPRLSPA
jgi:hypothetical protein